MGFKEAKELLLTICIILIVTNIFAANTPALSGLNDKTLKGDSIGYVSLIYDTANLQVNQATNSSLFSFIDISKQQTEGGLNIFTQLYDFASFAWSLIQIPISIIYGFLYTPMVLTQAYLSISGLEEINELGWLTWMVGTVWTILLVTTLLQILRNE